MDTDSLYLTLSEENFEDIVLPQKTNEWEAVRSRDCTDSFTANARGNFFPRTCCTAHKKHDKREPGLFEEEFRCSEMFYLCSKIYCCYDQKSNKYKFTSKGVNKRTLEDCGNGPMSKYRKVLEEAVNVTPTNTGFRTDTCRLYVTTMKAMNFQDDIPSISVDNFKDPYVLVFDLTSMQDATEHCHYLELIGEPLRLELYFNSPLENVKEVIVLGERISSVAVDRFGFVGENL